MLQLPEFPSHSHFFTSICMLLRFEFYASMDKYKQKKKEEEKKEKRADKEVPVRCIT
jgi:hypothetical protein